jgi:hypothetical protein
MKRVVVHIDQLVLRGFGDTDAAGVGAALQGELGRMLADRGAGSRLASLGHVASLNAGKVRLKPDARPRQLGISTGRAIAKGMSR